MRGSSGFTLIELMISIVIIGVVFGVIFTSTAVIRKNSRDTQRQADLRLVQSAIEQYYADQLYYPSSIAFSTSSSSAQLTNATGAPNGTTVTKTYLNKLPLDPSLSSTGVNYAYQGLKVDNSLCDITTYSQCVRYCLYAKLENPSNPAPTLYPQCTLSGYNFEVIQP